MKKMFFFLIVVISILPLSAVYHKIGEYETPGNARSVVVSNNIAYVADYDTGLQIIDVSNPQNPALLGSYHTPSWASSVFISNNIAYVADEYLGLQIIDVLTLKIQYFLVLTIRLVMQNLFLFQIILPI